MSLEKQVFFGQKISAKLIELIDGSRHGKSRSQWAREAFVEKLIRESPEQASALLTLIDAPDRAGVGGKPSHKKLVVPNDPNLPNKSVGLTCEIPDEVKRGVIKDEGLDLQSG
tara:strand:- start:12701 stop:13039 length:339 start_codon:yes stop_codon:yes gene_type:complete